jgi:hypothetical protein
MVTCVNRALSATVRPLRCSFSACGNIFVSGTGGTPGPRRPTRNHPGQARASDLRQHVGLGRRPVSRYPAGGGNQ